MMEPMRHYSLYCSLKLVGLKSSFASSLLIGILLLIGCGDSSEGLHQTKQDTIKLEYIAWACECAKWATLDDISRYGNDQNTDSLALMSVYLEPSSDSVELPDTIGFSSDIIELYGNYLPEVGFPNGIMPGEGADEARVFRYSGYRIIKSHYSEMMKVLKER